MSPKCCSSSTINSCIYPKIKITLTFTLTLLLEIGSKGLDLKGHFVLDVKFAVHLIRVKPGHKWRRDMMFLGLRKLGSICCGHKMFLNKIRNNFLCLGYKICVRNKCCARGQTGKHLCRKQCVRNNVSSFASTFSKKRRTTNKLLAAND